MDQFINNLEVQLNSETGSMHVLKQVSYQENEILMCHYSLEYLVMIIELKFIFVSNMLETEK